METGFFLRKDAARLTGLGGGAACKDHQFMETTICFVKMQPGSPPWWAEVPARNPNGWKWPFAWERCSLADRLAERRSCLQGTRIYRNSHLLQKDVAWLTALVGGGACKDPQFLETAICFGKMQPG